ncbi:MAG: FG-GAP-like repeat-containing protein [Pseudomonadota bacterium]
MTEFVLNAFQEEDLTDGLGFNNINASTGNEFTLPAEARTTMIIEDDDLVLSGDTGNNENAQDQTGQDALITVERDSGTEFLQSEIYIEKTLTVEDEDGNQFVMVEIEMTTGNAPGPGDDFFAFIGETPAPGAALTVVSQSNYNSNDLVYTDIADASAVPDVSDQSFEYYSDLPAGYVIGQVEATDADPDDSLSFAFAPGQTIDQFSLNATTGEITVAASLQDDLSDIGTIDLAIEVTDAQNNVAQSTVSLTYSDQFVALFLEDLDPAIGTQIVGAFNSSSFGRSLDVLSDFNGDGLADVAIGGPNQTSGQTAYVHITFGNENGLGALVDPMTTGAGQYIIGNTGLGQLLYDAGDFNGDGFTDIVIGENQQYQTASAYLIYGKADQNGLGVNVNPNNLTAPDGFEITDDGIGAYRSISGGGDFNGDGLGDLIYLASPSVDPDADPDAPPATIPGDTYIIFGTADNLGTSFNASSIDGTNGIVLSDGGFRGLATTDFLGDSFVGDLNGDGLDDIVLGIASRLDPGAENIAYVVYGTDSGVASISLATLDGTNGYLIGSDSSVTGITYDYAARATAGLGDINADGYDDFALSTYGAFGSAGFVPVVYGGPSGGATSQNVEDLDGSNGFLLWGVGLDDAFGATGFAAAGDVNGDGIDDYLVGAPLADPKGNEIQGNAGQSYVIYGNAAGFGESFSVLDLDGTNGFYLNAEGGTVLSGWSVAGGDVNGDGFSDLVVGAVGADPLGRQNAGEAYVVYGGNFTNETNVQGTALGETLLGTSGNDVMNAAQGDDIIIGGSGDDILTGAAGADIFVLSFGDGSDEIRDFDLLNDTLDLSGTGLSDIQAASTNAPGGLLIEAGNGDAVLLNGLSINDLNVMDIIF